MIRAALGTSTQWHATRAALEAARQIEERLEGQRPDWCVVYTTGEHNDNLEALLSTLTEALGTPYIVGCSASGILCSEWEQEGGPGLGVLAVCSDQIRATPFLFRDEGDQGVTAAARMGQRLLQSRESDDLLLAWPDPFYVRPDRLLQGLDAVLGSVPVVGGAASSNSEDKKTVQFCGTEAASAAVSGLRLSGGFQRSIGVTQGCRPLGEPMRVTHCHENLILELDGRPALELLRERAPKGLLDNQPSAFEFLFVAKLPDAESARIERGEYLVRNIVEVDPDTGVIHIADSIDEGQSIVFALREPAAAEQDLRRVLAEIAPRNGGQNYRFGLYFNCLARGRSLYRKDGVDSALLREALPGVPILGFFSNAEIGPLRGQNRLFTYTGVLLLVGE